MPYDPTANPFASMFFANDPNVSSDMRKRIALQMMMGNKRAYPKTLGEGLASIGDSIGDIMAVRQLRDIDAAENVAGDAALKKYLPGGDTTGAATPAQPQAPGTSVSGIAPQQNTPIVPAQAPGRGATPVAAGPDGMTVNPEDYNAIDAADPRNRYQPAPAYLQPALDRNIQDPERRGYLGQLAGKEAKSAGEVSSTGAAGPFQFTRGTGAQYGIPGNARFDPDASTRAVDAFTDDNVKALTAKLGREPTPGEMALAHQQGAGTAGNMLAGTGNAPARNLAVNNVPPGMGPQAAAQKVMGYYGMPAAAGGSPRDAVAATMVGQQRPTVADYGQKLALAATPQTSAIPGVTTAPPAAPIRQAPPPQQMAQSLVPPLPPEPTPPPTMTPIMQQVLQDIMRAPPSQREAIKKSLQPIIEQEKAKLEQAHEVYKDKLTARRTMETKQYELIAGAPKAAADLEKTRHDIAVGKIIQMEGRAFRVQDDGSLKDITPGQTGEGPPQIKMTQDQSDTLKFYKMGKTAAAQLEGKEDILAKGWADELAGKVPFVSNKLMSSQYRAAKNAAGLLVQADLRDTSGATIGTQEFADRFALLIPKSGDDPLALRNKAEARKAVLEGQRLALGTARPMADYVDKEHAKERAEKATKLDTEMAGKDKSKVYEKGGIHRKWNGSFWEEY